MPKSDSYDPIRKQPYFRNLGDIYQDTEQPGVMVWNSYANATGSAVIVQPNVSTLIVPARPERRALFIGHNSATGTAHFWFGVGHPAGLNAGLGPIVDFGSTMYMDGVRGLYNGPIYAIQDGTGPATLTWEEMW